MLACNQPGLHPRCHCEGDGRLNSWRLADLGPLVSRALGREVLRCLRWRGRAGKGKILIVYEYGYRLYYYYCCGLLNPGYRRCTFHPHSRHPSLSASSYLLCARLFFPPLPPPPRLLPFLLPSSFLSPPLPLPSPNLNPIEDQTL